MIIALASPRVASSVEGALKTASTLIADAAEQGADIVCFPEAWLPGLRGLDFEVPPFDESQMKTALKTISEFAARHGIAVVMGFEQVDGAEKRIASVVFDANGEQLGIQTKCQLDPTEEAHYVPGQGRRIFEVNGVRFGIAICHEAFRYPETVRWAAVRGASIVFHPHCTGSDKTGAKPTRFAETDGPYYEKAMMCRALENTIYFAGVNYAFRYPESATCVIGPDGACEAMLAYGETGLLIHEVDIERATRLLADRFAPSRLGKRRVHLTTAD